jgi:hypothetical protein
LNDSQSRETNHYDIYPSVDNNNTIFKRPVLLFFSPLSLSFSYNIPNIAKLASRFYEIEPLCMFCTQSHYIEVAHGDLFKEQKMRFGLVLGRLAILKKRG